MILHIATRKGPQDVLCLAIIDVLGVRCFAHPHPDDAGFVTVTEYATGRELGSGETIAEALEDARWSVSGHAGAKAVKAPELLRRRIQEVIAECGVVNAG